MGRYIVVVSAVTTTGAPAPADRHAYRTDAVHHATSPRDAGDGAPVTLDGLPDAGAGAARLRAAWGGGLRYVAVTDERLTVVAEERAESAALAARAVTHRLATAWPGAAPRLSRVSVRPSRAWKRAAATRRR